MENDKIVKAICFMFLGALILASNSFAGLLDSIECPQTKYKSTYRGPLGCGYENYTSINVSGFTDPNSTFSCTSYYWDYIYENKKPLEIDKKARKIHLYSQKSPVYVSLRLGPKEIKKKERPYWINKGKEMLRKIEDVAINCHDPEVLADIQSLKCPETKYKLINGKNGANCKYSKGIFIDSLWAGNKGSIDACSEEQYQDYLYNGKEPLGIEETDTYIYLFSQTHPARVLIDLNKKEFNGNRLAYWTDKAKEMLEQLEKITVDCTKTSPRKQIKTKSKRDNLEKKTIPKLKKTTAPAQPQSWDDWNAPSPKAK